MPPPARVEHPSELSDEALGCHALNHLWWVTRIVDAGINIGGEPVYRRYFACARGCGCVKRCLTDTDDGERWGWSRRQGEKYGTIGGWNKADMWQEVYRREQADPEWKIPGPEYGFEFDDDEYEIVVVRKPRRKRAG
jgi:hypothetical protein